MRNFVFFGPPGAGKGTQAVLIAKKYNFHHLSTGDLLRLEIKNGTELGIEAKKIIDKGLLVDDAIVTGMVKHLLTTKTDIEGFIFDGFPRTLKQAADLDVMLTEYNQKVNAVICLDVDEELIVTRMQKRAAIEGRNDDADINIIRQRIATYHHQTEPLMEYYKKQGKFIHVKGDSSIEEGFENICKVIDNN